MSKYTLVLVGVLFLVLLVPTISAETQIWQGKYLSGRPSTNYTFNFTVYDALIGGDSCWANTTSIATNTDKWWRTYQYDLLDTCDDVSKDYYLSIQINGEDQPPRRLLKQLKYADLSVNNNFSGNIYAVGNGSFYDLDVRSGQSFHIAGATFENEGHYTSIDTNWIVDDSSSTSTFIGAYNDNNSIYSNSHLILEAGGSSAVITKNSPLHPISPYSSGWINEEGNIGTFVDHNQDIIWFHYDNLTKDAYGNILALVGAERIMTLNDSGLHLENGDFIGNGSGLTGLTEAQITDLTHTTDTNRSDAEILGVCSVYNTTANIEGLGFVTGSHYTDSDISGSESAFSGWDKDSGDDFDGTWNSLSGIPSGFADDVDNDTNRSDVEILGVCFVYNDTTAIESVNTTSNIESLGFTQGSHTVDTNRSDAEILSVASVYNDSGINTTSNIEGLGFVTGSHTIDTNRSDAEILSVASVYNDTDWVLAQGYSTGDNLWTNVSGVATYDGDINVSGTSYLGDLMIEDSELKRTSGNMQIYTEDGNLYLESYADNIIIDAYGNEIFLYSTTTVSQGDLNIDADNLDSAAINFRDNLNAVKGYINFTDDVGDGSFSIFSIGPMSISSNDSINMTDLNVSGNITAESVYVDGDVDVTGTYSGNGSGLTGLTEAQITDLTHTTDTNRSDAEILGVCSVYNTTANIEGLGFVTGLHYTDADINGSESAFSGWDKNSSDDFDGYVSNLLGMTPGNPTIVGTYSNTTAMDGAEYVDVVGKYAYVTAFNSESLTILDISDPTNPVFVGWLKDTGNLNGATGIHVAGGYAYISNQNSNSFVIVDVSNPSSPTFEGSVTGMGTPIGLYVSGRYAYVTSSAQDRLYIIDISNSTNPVTVGTVTNSTFMDFATDVYVNGEYAYVSGYSSNSLAVVDISDPTSPSVIGGIINITYMQSARAVYSDGRYAYVVGYISDSLAIIDISDPTNPTMVGGVSSGLNGADSIQVLGDYAYVTEFVSNALSVVNVSDPTSPSIVGVRSGLTGAAGLDVSGKYAYVVSNSLDSLSVLDLGGIDSHVASIGTLAVSTIDVLDNAQVGNDLYVGNGLTVGSGGIHSQGGLSVQDDSYIDGNVVIADLAGSYTGGSAYVCVYNNGTLWASESACP